MTDDIKSHSNFERLLEHLQQGSLAAKFVSAYIEQFGKEPAEALRKVIFKRLEQVRDEYDRHRD
jgi:hypothetical protein